MTQIILNALSKDGLVVQQYPVNRATQATFNNFLRKTIDNKKYEQLLKHNWRVY